MLDGAPYTVVEFQFVKPGKGAAFTRTKMKNLLTGGVLERNLRSGERLEPADVETKTMQYLYADSDSFVFMDTTTYDQVQIPRDTVGDSANFMPENTNVEVLFFNGRAVDVTLPNFIEQARGGGRPRLPAATPRPAPPSRQRSRPAPASTCRSSSTSATSSRSTRARGSTSSASAAPSGPPPCPPRARYSKRGVASCARCAPGSRGKGSSRSPPPRASVRRARRSTSTRSPPARTTARRTG